MTDAGRRIRIALLDQKISGGQLAWKIGIKPGSLRNIIAGGPCSDATKQRITNTLGYDEIWPGVHVTERTVTLLAGLEIECGNESEAISAEKTFSGFIKRTGRKIAFIKSVRVIVDGIKSRPRPAERAPAHALEAAAK